MAATGSWEELPLIVISQVFGYLDNKDRFNASLTCKDWSDALYSPNLWRRVELHIGFDEMKDERSVKKMEKVGSWVKEVDIWSNNVLTERSASYIRRILGSLHEARLISVELNNLTRAWFNYKYDPQSVKVRSPSIIKFIRTQTSLQRFTMSSSRITLDQGMTIFAKLSLVSGNTLQHLDITDNYGGLDCELHCVPAFRLLMSRFTQLRSVHLNYSGIDEKILQGLAENCGGILQDLTLYCWKDLIFESDEDESTLQTISTSTWKKVHHLCPKLRANVFCIYQRNIAHLLPPGMPLRTLEYDCSDLEYPAATDLFQHLHYFTESLEVLDLDLPSENNSTTEQMVSLVIECRNLKEFRYHGNLEGRQIAAICEAQRDGRLKLESLELSIEVESDESDDTLDRIRAEYGPVFESQNAKLVIR